MYILGCTWIFGILVLLRPSFLHQLIFCICNSLQGFLIFLFHVYLSKPKRELWQTFFIQHGLHQRPHSSSTSGQTQLIAKSHSSTANLSSLTRPVKFRFTSSLSNHLDPLGATASLNRSFTDQSLNSSTAAPTKSISHSGIASQADFFRERFQQKNRLPMSQLYAWWTRVRCANVLRLFSLSRSYCSLLRQVTYYYWKYMWIT